MTALQGWIVIGLLVLIVLGIVGIGAEIEGLVICAGSATHHALPPLPAAVVHRSHTELFHRQGICFESFLMVWQCRASPFGFAVFLAS